VRRSGVGAKTLTTALAVGTLTAGWLGTATAAHAALQGTCGQLNITPPPPKVAVNFDENNTAQNLFNERTNLTLAAPLEVDLTPPAAFPTVYNNSATLPPPQFIPAGTTIDSWYVHTEPVGQPAIGFKYTSTIGFDRPILGVMVQWANGATFGPTTLDSSDAVAGAPGTTYVPNNKRGLEFTGHDDSVTWVDRNTVTLNFFTTTETDDVRIITTGTPPATPTAGYRFVASDGGIFNFGNVGFFGSMGGQHLNQPMVAGTSTCNNAGYWMVAADGGIFSFGNAKFFGSTGNLRLNKPIVTMSPTITNNGYWLFATDGGVFSFGDARFLGSMGGTPLNKPIVGGASSPLGGGYWMVASDGGIFSFGTSKFFGSTGDMVINKPVVGMAPTPDGAGYWLVASDGGIFSFGDAKFFGSTGAMRLNQPIVAMKPTRTGKGYWLIAADGGVFSFGDAAFFGSTGNIALNKPIVGAM
jgi:hypothetical protein